jgi:hypothetical protein
MARFDESLPVFGACAVHCRFLGHTGGEGVRGWGGGAGLLQCGDAKIKVSKYTTGKKTLLETLLILMLMDQHFN